jgi:hypothetical protein
MSIRYILSSYTTTVKHTNARFVNLRGKQPPEGWQIWMFPYTEGRNCFIIFLPMFYRLPPLWGKIGLFGGEQLKFYENWNFINFLKILKYWIFFFFIDILKFYEIFERVVSLLRHAMGCLPGNNISFHCTCDQYTITALCVGKHPDLSTWGENNLLRVDKFECFPTISQWEVSEV